MVKNLSADTGDTGDMGLIPGSGRSPKRKKWQPTSVFLPGKSCGQGSLEGYSPWSHKKSDIVAKQPQHVLTECLLF